MGVYTEFTPEKLQSTLPHGERLLRRLCLAVTRVASHVSRTASTSNGKLWFTPSIRILSKSYQYIIKSSTSQENPVRFRSSQPSPPSSAQAILPGPTWSVADGHWLMPAPRRSSGTPLKDEKSLRIIGRFGPHMLNTVFPVCPEKIKPQTVFLRIHALQQIDAQGYPLGRVHHALENRKLHPLSPVLAVPRYSAQTTPPGGILRVHVIAYQNQHSVTGSQRVDRRPGHRADSGQATAPGNDTAGPPAFFHAKKDARRFPVCAPAKRLSHPCGCPRP